MLRLQRQIGNRATLAVTADRETVRRHLDESFTAKGVPSAADRQQCKAFATKVSGLVDQAYDDLLTGNVKPWKGSKIATFLRLLSSNSPYALPWAGNAIEERVYELMKVENMGLEWVPQFAEGMGSASKPDIVVTLLSGKQALIDITSDRFHIEGKAGGWLTSDRYVYLAEAWFPSVLAPHLTIIRTGIEANGISKEHAQKLLNDAEEIRAAKRAEFKEGQQQARAELNDAGSFAAYAREIWGGDTTAASHFLQEWGIKAKGATRRKGPRKPSAEAMRLKKKKAAAKKYREGKKRKREEQEENETEAEEPVEMVVVDGEEEAEDEIDDEEVGAKQPTKKQKLADVI
jgi:hypothetical protein